LQNYKLQIIQGTNSDELTLLKNDPMAKNKTEVNYTQLLVANKENIAELQKQLHDYVKYDTLSQDLQQEISALFPKIKTINLSYATEIDMESSNTEKKPMAVAFLKTNQKMTEEEKNKFETWIKVRTKSSEMKIIIQ